MSSPGAAPRAAPAPSGSLTPADAPANASADAAAVAAASPHATGLSPKRTVRVWSPAVRLGHWALAACVLGALVLHEGGDWHERLGYAALAIACWRVILGLFTRDRFARFSSFVHGPRATWAHARAMANGREARHLGHNPLGGWMILALLTAALGAGATGALYVTDRFWGMEWLNNWHAWLGWAFAVLMPLHVVGVLLSSWLQRENLAGAMLHGTKARVTSAGVGVDDLDVAAAKGITPAGGPSQQN